MTTNINMHLIELDTSDIINAKGLFGATAYDTELTGAHGLLYYGAPVADWQTTFRFKTDNLDAIASEEANLKVMQSFKLITDNENATAIDVNTVYVRPESKHPTDKNAATYSNYYISDFDSNASSVDLTTSSRNGQSPDCALDFLSELARKIFGHPLAIDLLTNESNMLSNYGMSIEDCASNVMGNFASDSAWTPAEDIDTNSSINLKVADKIFNQLIAKDPTRFTLGYLAAKGAGSPATATGCAITATSGTTGTGATVNVTMDGDDIDNIVVNTAGSGYGKGDAITITTSAGNTVTIASLTSVQAGNLNGSMSDVEFPLLLGDIFHIKFTIHSNGDQENVKGESITLSRDADLLIKLQ